MYLLTNCMEQSTYPASQEITHILWNQKFRHFARHSLPFVPILSQIIKFSPSLPIYLLCNFSSLLLLLPLRLKYLLQNPPFCFAVNVRTKFTSTENNNQHYVSVYCDLCYVRYLTKKTKASGPTDGRYAPNLIYFQFLRACNFDLLMPLPNI